MAAQYELLKELLNSGTKLSFGQDFFFKFYQAFLLKDRWMQYINGVGTTLLVTALALALGVVLGGLLSIPAMPLGAYVSEIIRGGLMAVDPGQMEAGRSLGLNYMTTMVVIIIPQAIRAVLPALGNEFIVLLKDTSLITTIGGKELLYAAQGIMNRTYEAMFPLLGVALIYLILVMLFTWLLSKFERRLAQSDR